jgi:hypothetical protein
VRAGILAAIAASVGPLVPHPACAGASVVAAVAPSSSDVRKAVVVGPTGQVYEPTGKGEWVRRRAGGIAGLVTGAASAAGIAIVEVRNAPPFKLVAGAWTAITLSPKARATLGAGTRVIAATGKAVFALDRGDAKQLADLPARISAIGASAKHAVALTDKGVFELTGAATAWRAIKKLPKRITLRGLISDRYASTDRGVLDLTTMKSTAWPAGVRVDEIAAAGTTIVALAATGARAKPLELVVLTGKPAARGKPAVVREPTPFDGSADVVALVIDDDRRVLLATRDGRIALRAAGAWDGAGSWTVTQVRDEVPEPRPGAGPALSASP